MGHEQSVAASSIKLDPKQQIFVVCISSFLNEVLQSRMHCRSELDDFDVQSSEPLVSNALSQLMRHTGVALMSVSVVLSRQ